LGCYWSCSYCGREDATYVTTSFPSFFTLVLQLQQEHKKRELTTTTIVTTPPPVTIAVAKETQETQKPKKKIVAFNIKFQN